MYWPKFVETHFYGYLIQSEANPNLIASLKNSPRAKTFIDNLAQEISKAERTVHKRRGTPLKLETIKHTVYDFTKVLLRGIEAEATKLVESDIARLAREKESQYQKDLEATADGKVSGAFEDMGLKVNETQVIEEATDGREKGSAE